MATQLYRMQKNVTRNKRLVAVKRRFVKNDNVIVLCGKYKGTVTKILKQIGCYCFLDIAIEKKDYLLKALKRNSIEHISVKVHESNLQHYDIEHQKASKVSIYYRTQASSHKPDKINKIKVKKYLKTGREEEVKFVTKKEKVSTKKDDNNTKEVEDK